MGSRAKFKAPIEFLFALDLKELKTLGVLYYREINKKTPFRQVKDVTYFWNEEKKVLETDKVKIITVRELASRGVDEKLMDKELMYSWTYPHDAYIEIAIDFYN